MPVDVDGSTFRIQTSSLSAQGLDMGLAVNHSGSGSPSRAVGPRLVSHQFRPSRNGALPSQPRLSVMCTLPGPPAILIRSFISRTEDEV